MKLDVQQHLWMEGFWLPENITWKDIDRIYGVENALSMKNIVDCIYLVGVLTLIRFCLKNYVYAPLGIFCGLRSIPIKAVPPNPKLELFYKSNRKPEPEEIKKISRSLDLRPNFVANWFRSRRNKDKSSILTKFVESGWKFSFYTFCFTYGIYALRDKSYLWNIEQSMLNYPNHIMPKEIHWYYMLELGYYTASLGWIFYEVKRSDFKVLLGHHFATISLLLFSYLTNYHRIGAVIMLLHDIADCWMECAKMFKYIEKHKMAEILFTIFVLVWFLTRLVYLPFWVIHATWSVGFCINGYYPAFCIMFSFLVLLQGLHVYWFWLIMKIAIQVRSQGELAQDCRSESELSEVPSDFATNEEPLQTNGYVKTSKSTTLDSLKKAKTQKWNMLTDGVVYRHYPTKF